MSSFYTDWTKSFQHPYLNLNWTKLGNLETSTNRNCCSINPSNHQSTNQKI